MLMQHSLEQLRTLRLEGMARAFEEQLTQPAIAALSFEERFAQLIDREVLLRDGKRIERLLKAARIKVGGACLEDEGESSSPSPSSSSQTASSATHSR